MCYKMHGRGGGGGGGGGGGRGGGVGGDVLTRCMVEVAPAPIGGLAAARSDWSIQSVVAAVSQEGQ